MTYAAIGASLGLFVGNITFIAAWIYCIADGGFLLGFGLGWIPSAMLAAIVGFATRYLWPLFALAALAAVSIFLASW